MFNKKTQISEICSQFLNESSSPIFSTIPDSFDSATSNYQSNYLDETGEILRQLCDSFKQELSNDSRLELNYLIKNLIKFIYPVILLFGILGNMITFLTMIRIYNQRRKIQKFCFSLGALAVADLFVLIIGCLREYLETVFTIDIRSSSIYACKIVLFTCYLFSCFSVYLHGFIAIERWHAVSYPLKTKSNFTFRLNKLIIFFLFITCLIINLPLLWFPTMKQSLEIDNENKLGVKSIEECYVKNDWVLISIDSIFYCLIPFLITILFSVLTVFKLIQSKSNMDKSNETELLRQLNCKELVSLRVNKQFNSITGSLKLITNKTYDPKRKSFQSNISEFNNSINRNCLNGSTNSKLFSSSSSSNSTILSSSYNLKITIMLMALPISYLITTFPIFVVIIHSLILNQIVPETSSTYDAATAYSIAKIFMYVNNSINILIYIFFGKSLRKDFLAILPLKLLLNRFNDEKCNKIEKDFNHHNININMNMTSCLCNINHDHHHHHHHHNQIENDNLKNFKNPKYSFIYNV